MTAIGKEASDKGRFLLELYRKAQSLPEKELYNYFIEHAIKITKSKHGFFHAVSKDQKTVILSTWNREVLKTCTAPYETHYPIDKAGNWVDCIRQKKPIIYNDFPSSPNRKGYPAGHVEVKRMLTIPIIEEGQVSTIFGVGNKEEPYSEDDLLQLEVIANELNKIIKQRRAEEALHESNEKYHSLFANMLDAFVYCQLLFDACGKPYDFVLVEGNEAFQRLMHITQDNFGKKASELIPPDKFPRILQIVTRIASGDIREKLEVYYAPAKAWLAVSLYSPKKGYFAVVMEDITKRKETEAALKENEERLQQSQEIAHIGSWSYNSADGKISWSDEVYRIYGLKPEEFDGTFESLLKSVPEEERESVKETIIKAITQGNGPEVEHRVIRKNTGEIRTIHMKCNQTRNEAEKTLRLFGMVQDVTEQKRAEQALLESQEQLRLKLDSLLSPDIEIDDQELANIIDVPSLQLIMDYLSQVSNIAFALIDLKGKILVASGWQEICTKFHRVNPQTNQNCIESNVELARGLKRGQNQLYKCKNNLWHVATPLYIGEKHVGNVFFGQFFFEDETPPKDLFNAQAEKYGFDKKEYLEAFNKIPKLSRRNLEGLTHFYLGSAELVSKLSYTNLKLAKALTNEKQLQYQLEEKAVQIEEYASQMEELAEDRAKQLKDAERLSAIGATAGMVGHDIRNPLQAITNHLYLTRRKAELLAECDAKQGIVQNIRNIEDNLRYINKIVADLQDYAGPLNPKMERLKVEESIRDALAIVAVPERITVAVAVTENLPPLNADYTMLKRVLINLMQNAVQAMPTGGALTIEARNRGQNTDIIIQDTGDGIPPEVQAKIFTPLITTKAKGQGFGLAVVKRMIDAMGGTVTFETERGKGTKFILRFSPNS